MFESFEKCLKNQDTVILHLEILGLAVEIWEIAKLTLTIFGI